VARIGISLAVGAALIFPLDRLRVGDFGLGTLGLSLGASTAAWVEYGLLRRHLGTRVGEHGPGWRSLFRLLGAAALASSAAWAFRRKVWPVVFPVDLEVAGFGVSLLLQAVGTAGVFGVVYLALAGWGGQRFSLRRRRA
jgi:hypothetical protein